jgi:quercetin dioxygenase-like cupin family protein
MTVSLVRFTPGARTNWHRHAVGQILHATDEIGLVATRKGKVIRMRPGDTVYTPPREQHWHGGTDSTVMCHLAMLAGVSTSDSRSSKIK